MIKELKDMSIEKKLEEVREYRASRNETKFLTEYHQALQTNDLKKIKYFEKFGDSVRKCCMNLYAFEKQKEFGWMKFEFGEYGWAKHPDFLDVETVEFRHKSEKNYVANYVEVGRGLNGVWTFGKHFGSNDGSGGASGLSIYGNQFESKGLAMVAGVESIKEWLKKRLEDHEKHADHTNVKPDFVKAVLKMIDSKLDELQGNKSGQVDLFKLLEE